MAPTCDHHSTKPIDLSVDQQTIFVVCWSSPSRSSAGAKIKMRLWFLPDQPADLTLIMKAAPFVVAGLKDSQRLSIKLNPGSCLLDAQQWHPMNRNRLAASVAQARERIDISFPDARIAGELGLSDDRRLLGLCGQWIEFKTH